MRLINIIWSNVKRLCKNRAVFVSAVFLPMIVLVAVGSFNGDGSHNGSIFIANKSSGEYSQELIEKLNTDYSVSLVDEMFLNSEEAKKADMNLVILIDENYDNDIRKSNMPKVTITELSDDIKNRIIAMDVDTFIKGQVEHIELSKIEGAYIKSEIIESEKFPVGIVFAMMIIYYSFLSTTFITDDMLKLKNQNVLKRAITTANKDFKVLIGLFIGSFIFLGTATAGVFVIAVKATDFLEGVKLFDAVLAALLTTLVFIAITIFIVRWFKNANAISAVSSVIGLAFFGLGILGTVGPYISENLDKFKFMSYISPIYWAGEIMNGNILEGSVILILMAIAIFTTGSYKLRDFAIK